MIAETLAALRERGGRAEALPADLAEEAGSAANAACGGPRPILAIAKEPLDPPGDADNGDLPDRAELPG